MQVRGAPKFTAISGSHANKEDNSVDLLFDAVDGQRYKVELDPHLIPAMLIAIAGHANELASIHGDPPIQPLPVKKLSSAMAQDGGISLMLHSESGLKSVLTFSPDQLSDLRAILGEIDELLSRRVQ